MNPHGQSIIDALNTTIPTAIFRPPVNGAWMPCIPQHLLLAFRVNLGM